MLETICDVLKAGYDRNWSTSRDSNVSIRYYGRDYFFITPTGVRKQTLQPDQFKKIGISSCKTRWQELEYTPISQQLKPSGELPLHFGLQRNLGQHAQDTRVVVHLHPTYTVAAMHAGIELADLVKDFPELSRYTRVAKNVGDQPPISQQLADACHQQLEVDEYSGYVNYDIVGLKGHGVVAIDSSPWRAYEHIERLEHISKIVLVSGNY
jgi:L-fuculose-phosphate aldolase